MAGWFRMGRTPHGAGGVFTFKLRPVNSQHPLPKPELQPTPAKISSQTGAVGAAGLKPQVKNGFEPGHDTRIEQAEARTEQAEARTEQARTRTEEAESRTEQAETRTEQAKSRTEQAETRTELAEIRTELAETLSEEAVHASEQRIRALNAELEQRVADRTAQLENANEKLKAFSYSVSHDLRAPLRHILGFAEILQKNAGPSLSKENLQHLTVILRAAKRMGNLIDDLLAFARIGQAELRKTTVDLDQLVRETSGELQADTPERDIAWEIHPLPAVRADAALLRLALVNLISNALKFSSTRARAKIEIGCVPGGDHETVLFIRDNGVGFDPRYADRLFGVFQRLHADFEGTGIGLANVRRIIEAHGGRTWAEGVVDGGATFYLALPKQPVPPEKKAVQHEIPAPHPAS
jgi:signal transduction histidine kinase